MISNRVRKPVESGAPACQIARDMSVQRMVNLRITERINLLPIVTVTDREGKYYFVEGCYNATTKLYFGARQSKINFNKSTIFTTLNSINANSYTRTSIALVTV